MYRLEDDLHHVSIKTDVTYTLLLLQGKSNKPKLFNTRKKKFQI